MIPVEWGGTEADPLGPSLPGQAVRVSGFDVTTLVSGAKATNTALAIERIAIGLMVDAVPRLSIGNMRFIGPLTLTTAQWDAVTGGVGGLILSADYYVSTATPATGFLVTPAPAGSGDWRVYVGTALSPTTMLVSIGTPIQNP